MAKSTIAIATRLDAILLRQGTDRLNLIVGWICILLGVIAGAVIGLFFWREDWLGGYNSWCRRMTRLGHISFFGLGLINIAFELSVSRLALPRGPALATASYGLFLGAATMPLVCFLSAWRQPFRHLFVVPVAAVATGVAILAIESLGR
jgi:hypothetical protein